MTLPGTYETSHLRCPRDGKRLVVEIGQDSDSGWVHEFHWCLSCDYRIRERPRADRTPYVLGVKELLKIRTRHVDRGGKELLVSQIAKMSRAEFEEWANG